MGLRLRTGADAGGGLGPNASSASPGRTSRASRRRRGRGVMALELAGCGRPLHAASVAAQGPPEHGLDELDRDGAGPQERNVRARRLEDGGFEAVARRPGVEDHRHFASEVGSDVLGPRRADVAERFAEGAASGTPAAAMSARATAWSGTRRATVGGRPSPDRRGELPPCAPAPGSAAPARRPARAGARRA